MQLEIALVFCLSFGALRGHEEVYLIGGSIRGTTMTTRNGRTISAYLGIPYGEPPVGPLRFNPPRRKWAIGDGFPGDKHGNMCPQLNDDGQLIGDEDCLSLNVYTPDTQLAPGVVLYPVMVYFHGGNFVKGSSREAGPDYLLDRDVVLVTVNYRLGALGFLSTGDTASPGNYGLKDQNLALQWVRDNILGFRGDPNRVTLFGVDAGGASAHLHAVAAPSRGLFHRYIAQSGESLAYWAFTEKRRYRERSTDVGEKLNCPTERTQELMECLRKVDVYSLVNSDDIFANEFWTFSTWTPTAEVENADQLFLEEIPLHRILMRGIYDVPSMVGAVANEGLVFTSHFNNNDTLYDRISKNSLEFITYLTKLFFSDEDTAGKKAKDFYLGGIDPNDRNAVTQALTDFVGDALVFVSLELETRVLAHSTKSPVYEYLFNYRGTFSQSTAITGSNENLGVDHGDDLIYLFPLNPKLKTSPDLRLSESDEIMIDTMVDLWTSFAATGIPTTGHSPDPFMWKGLDPESLNYLTIGNGSSTELIVDRGLRLYAIAFWNKVLADDLAGFMSLNG